MAASQPANFNLQEFTDDGLLLVGGRIYTYTFGTTTHKVAYTDPAGVVPYTYTSDGLGGQYIALNARGELTGPLYLTSGSYDIALKRADGSTVWTRKADGVDSLTVSLASSVGASIVGFIQSGVGAVLRFLQDRLRDSVLVTDFAANGVSGVKVDKTGVVDSGLGITAAKVYAQSIGARLVFPAGTYKTSTALSLFWAGGAIFADGLVTILSSVATGPILSLDAGVGTNGYRFKMQGLFVLDGSAGAPTIGLYTRNVHHSEFEVDVKNVVTAGVQIDGAVLDKYKIRVSVNGTAMTTTPVNGVIVNGSAIITDTTDCDFYLVIEGVTGTGVVLNRAALCRLTGTSEGNGGLGLLVAAASLGNSFYEFFFEANSVGGDIDCYGKGNIFNNCAATSRAAASPFESVKSIIFRAGSERNIFRGGQCYAVTVEALAVSNRFEYLDCSYAINDLGINTEIIQTRQLFNSSAIFAGHSFGNAADARTNVLDYYDESGTFTPFFTGSTTAGTIAYSLQSGKYTRVGNLIHGNLSITVSALTTSPTGNLLIGGLPFASNATDGNQSVAIGSASLITLPASRVQLMGHIPVATTTIRLTGVASGLAATLLDASTSLGASTIFVQFSYRV